MASNTCHFILSISQSLGAGNGQQKTIQTKTIEMICLCCVCYKALTCLLTFHCPCKFRPDYLDLPRNKSMKVCTSTSRRNCDHLVNTGISKSCFLFSATACLGASTQIRVGAASSAVRVYEGEGSVRVRRPASFQVVSGSGNFPYAWELVSDLVWFQRGSGRLGVSVQGPGRIVAGSFRRTGQKFRRKLFQRF